MNIRFVILYFHLFLFGGLFASSDRSPSWPQHLSACMRAIRSHHVNESNGVFYEATPPRTLKKREVEQGLSEHRDIDRAVVDDFLMSMFKFVKPTSPAQPLETYERSPLILDIGAGIGRTEDFLLKRYPYAYIHALEMNPHYVRKMKNRFRAQRGIKVISANILRYKQNNFYHAAFWLWSGSLEFGRVQFRTALGNISHSLKRGAPLIIDIPHWSSLEKMAHVLPSTKKFILVPRDPSMLIPRDPTTFARHDPKILLQDEGSTLIVRRESQKQFERDCMKAGFEFEGFNDYETDSGKRRITYLFRKKMNSRG